MSLIILVTLIFAAIVAIVFLDPFGFPEESKDKILLSATFLLAYIAVLTIIYGHIQNSKIRKQSLLLEIDEWARNGHKILTGYLPKQTWHDRNNTVRVLAEINVRKTIMINSANLFGDDLSLEIQKATDDIDMFCKHLESYIEDLETDNIEYANMDVLQEQCDKSFIRVFELTSIYRTKLRI